MFDKRKVDYSAAIKGTTKPFEEGSGILAGVLTRAQMLVECGCIDSITISLAGTNMQPYILHADEIMKYRPNVVRQ